MSSPGELWDAPDAEVIEYLLLGDQERHFGLSASAFWKAMDHLKIGGGSVICLSSEEAMEIRADGVLIGFSPEPSGWQISMLNPPSVTWAKEAAEEIRQAFSLESGMTGVLREL